MHISVKAVRDLDGAALGEAVFDPKNKPMVRQAMADLMEHVYAEATPLQNWTFKQSSDFR
jgi:hypothetical protein